MPSEYPAVAHAATRPIGTPRPLKSIPRAHSRPPVADRRALAPAVNGIRYSEYYRPPRTTSHKPINVRCSAGSGCCGALPPQWADRMAHARGDQRVELRGHALARLAMVLPHSHVGRTLQCVAADALKQVATWCPIRADAHALELQWLHVGQRGVRGCDCRFAPTRWCGQQRSHRVGRLACWC